MMNTMKGDLKLVYNSCKENLNAGQFLDRKPLMMKHAAAVILKRMEMLI
jgi:hypothetical protein